MLRLTAGCPLIAVKLQTDSTKGEFWVVSLAICASLYLMDVVVVPEGGSIGRNGVFEEFATRCLVDLNRLTVRGMRLKFH